MHMHTINHPSSDHLQGYELHNSIDLGADPHLDNLIEEFVGQQDHVFTPVEAYRTRFLATHAS
jgi:hypothetical protein